MSRYHHDQRRCRTASAVACSEASLPIRRKGRRSTQSSGGNSVEDGSPSPTALRKPDKQDLAEPPAVTAVEATSKAPQSGVPETSSTKPIDAAKGGNP